jgi:hypothetical protein
MNSKFFKYVTPLRILFIVLLITTLFQFDEYYQVAFNDKKDGFTGIGFIISAITTIVILIVDILLSYFLNPKKNWIFQALIIGLLLVLLFLI